MPSAPVPNTAQITLQFTLGGTNAQNSYYVRKASAWTAAELDDMIDAFETWWTAGADSIMAIEASLIAIKATDLTSLDTGLRSKSMSHPGGAPGPAAPVNSTFAFKFDTGKRGRGRAGRIFYPFPAEDTIDAYTIPAITLDEMVGFFNDLIDVVSAAVTGAEWVVVGRIRNGVPLTTGITNAVLRVVAVDNTLDSMKNRLPNHRRSRRPSP